MKKINLRIVDETRHWTGLVGGDLASNLIASLSADPLTIDELCHAATRFIDPVRLPESLKTCAKRDSSTFARKAVARKSTPGDNLAVIDLDQRIVVWPTGEHVAEGQVAYLGPRNRQGSIRYQLHEDWRCVSNWAETGSANPRVRSNRRRANGMPIRDVLYGDRLLEFIVDRCDQRFAKLIRDVRNRSDTARFKLSTAHMTRVDPTRDNMANADSGQPIDPELLAGVWEQLPDPVIYNLAVNVHAGWLVHKPSEFEEARNRDVMFGDLFHIDADIVSRIDQWGAFGTAPVPLRKTDGAVQQMGFGTNETNIYFALVRSLIYRYLEERTKRDSTLPRDRQSGIDWLRIKREIWLDEPGGEESRGRSPRQIIDSERLRMPLLDTSSPLDCDCPICQMMADDDVPSFILFGGMHMEQVYPFSIEEFEMDETVSAVDKGFQTHSNYELEIFPVDPHANYPNRQALEALHGADELVDGEGDGKGTKTNLDTCYDMLPGESTMGIDTHFDAFVLSHAPVKADTSLEFEPPEFEDRPPSDPERRRRMMEVLKAVRESKIQAELRQREQGGAGGLKSNADDLELSPTEPWKRVCIGPIGSIERDRFVVAACTGELVEDIKSLTLDRALVDGLMRQVGNVVSLMRDESEGSLMLPVAQAFCELLEDVRVAFEELGPKVEDLQVRLMQMVRTDFV